MAVGHRVVAEGRGIIADGARAQADGERREIVRLTIGHSAGADRNIAVAHGAGQAADRDRLPAKRLCAGIGIVGGHVAADRNASRAGRTRPLADRGRAIAARDRLHAEGCTAEACTRGVADGHGRIAGRGRERAHDLDGAKAAAIGTTAYDI